MILTWQRYIDPIFGRAYRLEGLREGEAGNVHRHGRRYIACATIDGTYLSHVAHTDLAAMNRLNAEIDRRSIGLFGEDTVEFVVRD